MGLYEPKSCCICFDTKNGSLIIASLSLIVAATFIFLMASVTGLLGLSLQEQYKPRMESHELDQHEMDSLILYTSVSVLIYYIINGICSSLLIHGIRKDRPSLMLPYIIWDRICIVFWFVSSLYRTGKVIYLSNEMEFIYFVLPSILATIVVIFLHLVVNAYHNQVKRAVAHSGGEAYSYPHKELINDDDMYKIKV